MLNDECHPDHRRAVLRDGDDIVLNVIRQRDVKPGMRTVHVPVDYPCEIGWKWNGSSFRPEPDRIALLDEDNLVLSVVKQEDMPAEHTNTMHVPSHWSCEIGWKWTGAVFEPKGE